MPLFGNKFVTKKTPPRKSASLSSLHREFEPSQSQREFGLDCDRIGLRLGNHESVFLDGQWIMESGSSGAAEKDAMRLKKQNLQLTEENNLLKLKVEVLLDMLTEATAEMHLQEKEIEDLKKKCKTKRK